MHGRKKVLEPTSSSLFSTPFHPKLDKSSCTSIDHSPSQTSVNFLNSYPTLSSPMTSVSQESRRKSVQLRNMTSCKIKLLKFKESLVIQGMEGSEKTWLRLCSQTSLSSLTKWIVLIQHEKVLLTINQLLVCRVMDKLCFRFI